MKRVKILGFALILALTSGCSASFDGTNSMTNATPESGAGSYEALPSEDWRYAALEDTEEYATASDSPFKEVKTSPLSTFSADVDTASYSSMRRFINQGRQPEGIRIEELINYFDYDYPAPAPEAGHPFSVTAEAGACPWEPNHLLAMIGIQGMRLRDTREIANNVVFLIDVSGSMDEPNKLPLVKESMKLLLNRLGPQDVISIVTYAGSDKIMADSVPASEKNKLIRLINGLGAGGSTAGARGLRTAYELAAKNYIEGGNNRIILATDGDFNVGESSVDELIELVGQEREGGVFLSVLGYGMGNLKDNMMKNIAMHGNGNYAYIDNIQEAKKVLVDEFDAAMFAIAKDVKLQVEFNPETVSSYRLVGYNTRRLENEDFNDDAKDAGDIGSGHSVTAFYELVLAGTEEAGGAVDPLKYSQQIPTGSEDYMTVKIRYKEPDGSDSRLAERTVGPESLGESENFLFASAVAEFGLIVTRSDDRGGSSLDSVLRRADSGMGADDFGLRAEFLELVRAYGRINR